MRIVEEQQAAEKARLAAERAEEKKKREEQNSQNSLSLNSSEGMSSYPGRNSEERMPSHACKVPICSRVVRWWLCSVQMLVTVGTVPIRSVEASLMPLEI